MNISTYGSQITPLTNVSASVGLSQAQPGDGASATTSSKRDAFRSDFASLLQAVQSGDMTTAQSALQSIQTDTQSSAVYSPSSSSGQSPIGNDLQALFTAVRSGDTSGAQTALANFTTDIDAAKAGVTPQADDASTQQLPSSDPSQSQGVSGHHHHHHGGGGGLQSLVSSLVNGSSSTDAAATSDPETAAALNM